MSETSGGIIQLKNLSKGFWVRGIWAPVLDDITMTLPKRKAVAVLGRNGAGKSTLLRIIAGSIKPSSGQIVRGGSVSWPIGFSGSFHRELTGAQNVLFIARAHGVDTQALIGFVEDFAELGAHFHMPVRSYSSGMLARLAFGASMGVGFDVYLIDEVTAVGDARFREKSASVLMERLRHSGALLVSHNMDDIRRLCDAALVLHCGKLIYFDDVDLAIQTHKELMQ